MRIMLDPGHGGRDPGAVANGIQEKNIALDISLRLRQYLLATFYCNDEVKLTREVDVYVSHVERCTIANQFKADLFYSIHTNAFSDPNANGFETYVYRELSQSAKARVYRRAIHSEIMDFLQGKARDRSMREAGFYVLRYTNMPAVLAEYLFISNPKEAQLLGSPHFREGLAYATGEGIAKALGLKRKTQDKKEGEADLEERAVVYYPDDEPAARRLAIHLSCGLFPREVAEKRIIAKKIYVVGGTKEGLKGVTFVELGGQDFFETTQKVKEYLTNL